MLLIVILKEESLVRKVGGLAGQSPPQLVRVLAVNDKIILVNGHAIGIGN